MNPRDEFTSLDERFSLGMDEDSGSRYASFPVSNGVVDYEEYYALTEAQYALFRSDSTLALNFVDECRGHEHDDLLLQKPGWNRGTPV